MFPSKIYDNSKLSDWYKHEALAPASLKEQAFRKLAENIPKVPQSKAGELGVFLFWSWEVREAVGDKKITQLFRHFCSQGGDQKVRQNFVERIPNAEVYDELIHRALRAGDKPVAKYLLLRLALYWKNSKRSLRHLMLGTSPRLSVVNYAVDLAEEQVLKLCAKDYGTTVESLKRRFKRSLSSFEGPSVFDRALAELIKKAQDLLDKRVPGNTTVDDESSVFDAWPYLSLAVMTGNVQLVRHLLDRGVNPDESGLADYTPLQLAAYHKQPEIIELLLSKKAAIDGRNTEEPMLGNYPGSLVYTPLNLDDALEQATASLAKNVSSELTPLEIAAHCGHARIFTRLLQRGADLFHNHDSLVPGAFTFTVNREFWGVRELALRAILALKAPPSHETLDAMLREEVIWGTGKLIKPLLAAKANPRTKPVAKRSAIELCLSFDQDGSKLIQFDEEISGEVLKGRFGQSLLTSIIRKKMSLFFLRKTLRKLSVEEWGNLAVFALGEAACLGYPKRVRAFLEEKIPAEHGAVGYEPLEKALLSMQAKGTAVSAGRLESAKLIIQALPNPLAEKYHHLLTHLVSLRGELLPLVDLMMSRGVDINVQDNKGWTVLHTAAWYNAEEKLISALLYRGADPLLRNQQEERASDFLAHRRGASFKVLKEAEKAASISRPAKRQKTNHQ